MEEAGSPRCATEVSAENFSVEHLHGDYSRVNCQLTTSLNVKIMYEARTKYR